MPGLSVCVPVEKLAEPWLTKPVALGVAKAANGSGTEATCVVGAGVRIGEPVFETPPTTRICVAVICEVPLIVKAELELESTTISPLTLMKELPLTVKAPLRVGLRTITDGPTTTVSVTVVGGLLSCVKVTTTVREPKVE